MQGQEIHKYTFGANFSKKDSIPSRIPPYFFVNVPVADKRLARALEDLGAEAIQLSYKLN